MRFYEARPGRAYALLTEMLREADRSGCLTIPDPSTAAGELAGIWYGYIILRINLKVAPPTTEAEIRRRAVRGVEVLYRLYG